MKLNMKILVGSISLGLVAYAAYAETVTISTYYPSPYGNYANLETTADTYLATTSGNVGIGNVVPGAKLDVTGNLLLSGGRSTILTTGDNTTTHRGGLQIVTPDSGATMILTPTNSAGATQNGMVRLGGAGSFNSNIVGLGVTGSVGAGTAVPSYTLHAYSLTTAPAGVIGVTSSSGSGPLRLVYSGGNYYCEAVYA